MKGFTDAKLLARATRHARAEGKFKDWSEAYERRRRPAGRRAPQDIGEAALGALKDVGLELPPEASS